MTARSIDHVSISVSDIDRSLEFYQRLLGIPVLGRGEEEGPPVEGPGGPVPSRFRFADLDVGRGQVLELLQWLSPLGGGGTPSVHNPGSGHVGLQVDDLDAALHRLTRAGFPPRFQPITMESPAWWAGARVVYVSDPDGATIELVQWPTAEGRPASRSSQARTRR